MNGYVENPVAYEAAISRRIKANANVSRARKFAAEIEQDGEDFGCWLRDMTPTRVRESAEPEQAAKQYYRTIPKLPAFLRDALIQWGGLTAGQVTFARKVWSEHAGKVAERAAERANAQPWTAGRQEVTGVVKSAREETFFANRYRSSTSVKGLLMTADGRRVWSTIPRKFGEPEAVIGQTITFTVTIEVAADDPTMAFGKRPS